MYEWREQVERAVVGLRPGAKGFVRVNCPACEERHGSIDRKRSLSVNRWTGWWRCWRCRWRGRLQDFQEDVEDDTEGWEEEPSELEDPGTLAPVATSRWAKDARDYLTRRGIPEQVWVEAGLGVAVTGKPSHKGRIVFPVTGPDGALIGWASRHPDGREPRYQTAGGMDRERLFYNDRQLTLGTGPVWVVEGPMDTLAVWPQAVGCLGKPSPKQLERLLICQRPVVFILDGDAWQEAEGCVERLRLAGKPDVWYVRLPPGEDPCTVPQLAREAAEYALAHQTDVDVI